MKKPRNDTRPSSPNELPVAARREDRERIGRINSAIRAASRDLRDRYPFLRHQDAIGLGLLLASVGVAVAAGAAYLTGLMPGWATIVLVALGTSIVHEIEHDLIHLMYFRKNPVVRAAMMALGWLVRPNTINPWLRKELHLHHHKMSGTPTDLEERAITNGEAFDLKCKTFRRFTDSVPPASISKARHGNARVYRKRQSPRRRLVRRRGWSGFRESPDNGDRHERQCEREPFQLGLRCRLRDGRRA
jgi:hypothetical protein